MSYQTGTHILSKYSQSSQFQMTPGVLCDDRPRGKNVMKVKLTLAYGVTSEAQTGTYLQTKNTHISTKHMCMNSRVLTFKYNCVAERGQIPWSLVTLWTRSRPASWLEWRSPKAVIGH